MQIEIVDRHQLGLEVARAFSTASDEEWPDLFDRLRKDGQLSLAMQQINGLLHDAAHRDVALAAIRRIGLDNSV